MADVTAILNAVRAYRPRKVWWRRWAKRSAVAVIVHQREAAPHLLLMKRATRAGDPWSGDMAFPGGRAEPSDPHILGTAVRETCEETGLDLGQQGRTIGRLSDVVARPRRQAKRPLLITPFVFQIEREPQWQLDPHEVDSLLWVPLPFLADPSNRQTMMWQRGQTAVTLPCYEYQGRRIWGLTLRILDELVVVVA